MIQKTDATNKNLGIFHFLIPAAIFVSILLFSAYQEDFLELKKHH